LGSAPIVASTIPIGVGTAFAAKYRGEHRITAVFFGDAAVETGVFHESVNFALVHSLPVIFVCENNLYSVYTSLEPRQPAGRGLAQLAAGMGMMTAKGDGNDVSHVVRLSETAVNHARSGQGPFFLEFTTYRWREHCGPNFDNDIGYRTEAEFESWRELCPIEQCKSELISNGTASESELVSIDRQLNDNINAAFEAAKSDPFPASHEALEQVFAN
jgi:TPP-dependent pyruvate/acetoin dehydrogenase alpha subunit